MIKVGLTGGIGSGKTTVAKIFEQLGIPVYYADNKAKELMTNDYYIKKKIKEIFGEKSYINENLNTKFLANIVFDDKSKLKKLEKIIHPKLRNDFDEWVKNQKAPYVILENAILLKSGMYKQIDYLIFVSSEEKVRIKRIKNRDKLNERDIKNRMKNQDNLKFLHNSSNFIIKNNFNLNKLIKNVKNIDLTLKKTLNKS